MQLMVIYDVVLRYCICVTMTVLGKNLIDES